MILVYDETDAQSFNELKKWVETAFSYTNGAMSFVVGNKTDLLQPGAPRPVTEEQAQAYANSLFATLHHVSALTGSGTEETINSITQQLIQQFAERFFLIFTFIFVFCETVPSLKRDIPRAMTTWGMMLFSPNPSSRRRSAASAEHKHRLRIVWQVERNHALLFTLATPFPNHAFSSIPIEC